MIQFGRQKILRLLQKDDPRAVGEVCYLRALRNRSSIFS
jgi:hypothetical protein